MKVRGPSHGIIRAYGVIIGRKDKVIAQAQRFTAQRGVFWVKSADNDRKARIQYLRDLYETEPIFATMLVQYGRSDYFNRKGKK